MRRRRFGLAPGVWIVHDQETASPAMVRGEAGRDLFAHGRLWIESTNGTVLKTDLLVEQPAIRAQSTTTFREDDRFGIAVPDEMRERYAFSTGSRIATIASYGRFRRFDVTADEDIHVPTHIVTDTALATRCSRLGWGCWLLVAGCWVAGRWLSREPRAATLTPEP